MSGRDRCAPSLRACIDREGPVWGVFAFGRDVGVGFYQPRGDGDAYLLERIRTEPRRAFIPNEFNMLAPIELVPTSIRVWCKPPTRPLRVRITRDLTDDEIRDLEAALLAHAEAERRERVAAWNAAVADPEPRP